MTDQCEGKSAELGGRSWVCYLRHLGGHAVGSLLFPSADGEPILFAMLPPLPPQQCYLKKELTSVVHLNMLGGLEKHWLTKLTK